MKSFKILLIILKRYLERYYKHLFLVLVLIGIAYFVVPKSYNHFSRDSISQAVVGTYTEDNLPDSVTNLVSDGLVVLDKNGIPKPVLAQSWTVNSNATEYQIKLKDNLFWTDGNKVSARDLLILIPEINVEAKDDKTLVVKLADSFSPLPTLLTKPVLKKDSPIGTGPYQVTKIEKSQVFVNKVVLSPVSDDLPEVIVKFYPSEKIAINALKKGEVQSVLGVNDLSFLQNQKPFKVFTRENYTRLVAIFYNTHDAILSDRNLRLALSFAAPSIKDQTEAKTSIPSNSWAFNPEVKDFLDNPDQSKAYLDRVDKGKDSTIVLTSIESLKSLGEQVVAQWEKIGIKAVLRVESGVPQNFQALLISQNIPADPDQYSLWHSTQTQSNISNYSSPNQYSPRVDKDLEDGRKATDLEVRKTKYKDFQKVLTDDAPATFLYFPKYNVVYLSKVEDNLKKVIDLQLPQYK